MEAATSATIASLERASFVLLFDVNKSIFSFCAERVTYYNNTQIAAIVLLPSTTHPQLWAESHIINY